MIVSRLIYVSRARDGIGTAELERLVERARVNNAMANVTGLLLFDGRNFMQLLEGPEDEVEGIFDAIVADMRHSDIIRICSASDVPRQFPNWSMGYALADDKTPENRAGWFKLTHDALQSVLPENIDPAVRMLFTSFLSADKPARD
jgi:hypothetical protein